MNFKRLETFIWVASLGSFRKAAEHQHTTQPAISNRIAALEDELLLGLYEGIPLTEREEYSMVLPDKITLYQKSIETICADNDEIIEQVRETVVHEVAHHFGLSDAALDHTEYG